MSSPVPRRTIIARNRASWNEATRAHNSHKGGQVAFLRGGSSTLFPEEIDLLGPIHGGRLLHLQCNSGQDSLSLAALGFAVTGVDFSDEAIATADHLSHDTGIPARFERADVYDWLAEAAPNRRFEVVFSSYGAVCWLPDLASWANGIHDVLMPGGSFVLVEFHPMLGMIEMEGADGTDWRLRYDYSTGGVPAAWGGVDDYVARSGAGLVPWGYEEGQRDFHNPHDAYGFGWGVADVVTAVLDAGLRLEALREYPYANGCRFPGMRQTEGRRTLPPDGMPSMPLMYGLRAIRPD